MVPKDHELLLEDFKTHKIKKNHKQYIKVFMEVLNMYSKKWLIKEQENKHRLQV